jgi:hypothetical protein
MGSIAVLIANVPIEWKSDPDAFPPSHRSDGISMLNKTCLGRTSFPAAVHFVRSCPSCSKAGFEIGMRSIFGPVQMYAVQEISLLVVPGKRFGDRIYCLTFVQSDTRDKVRS